MSQAWPRKWDRVQFYDSWYEVQATRVRWHERGDTDLPKGILSREVKLGAEEESWVPVEDLQRVYQISDEEWSHLMREQIRTKKGESWR